MTKPEEASREPTPSYITMMLDATAQWIRWLEDYPGWKEWNRDRLNRALYDDDLLPDAGELVPRAFVFSEAVERQHTVVFQYILNRPGFPRHSPGSLRNAFQTLPVTADC